MIVPYACGFWSVNILGLSWLVFLGGVAKVNSILVMVQRNANHAFLAPLSIMDLKPSHLVIALRNANRAHGRGAMLSSWERGAATGSSQERGAAAMLLQWARQSGEERIHRRIAQQHDEEEEPSLEEPDVYRFFQASTHLYFFDGFSPKQV
jgi:hypothetical protein